MEWFIQTGCLIETGPLKFGTQKLRLSGMFDRYFLEKTFNGTVLIIGTLDYNQKESLYDYFLTFTVGPF